MSCDRVVRWKSERPSTKEIRMMCEDFLGGACVSIQPLGSNTDEVLGSYTCLLHGEPKSPFRRMKKFPVHARMREVHNERWFEVTVMKDCVYVTTRMADEYTNVVAAGFAELLRRSYQASVDSM